MDNSPFREFGEMFAEAFTPSELRQRQEKTMARLALGAEGDKLALAEDWNTIGNDFRNVIKSLEQYRADHIDTLDVKEEE